MSYLPLTPDDQQAMLDTIGVEHFGQILQAIPASLRNPAIEIPEALSEHEIRALFAEIGRKNVNTKEKTSFLGAGAYEHFIPSLVNTVISRSEFYTAYTPYQAEASQGTLQAIFEYQSLMCELTGMDVSNGSHYDGSTALAEAALLSLNKTGRNTVLVAKSLHPEFRQVIQSYLSKTGKKMVEIPFEANGGLNLGALKSALSPEIASVILSTPNFLGVVEDLTGVSDLIHQNGSLFILTGNPLSYAYYKTPAEWGADISCGEGQPLGIPMSFGGPWLGYFTTTRELIRQIPGRLVGLTKDMDGRRAYCLTLQAREQHIRREKAASNICTNQALCAVAACVYMAALGKNGLKQVAELNLENAYYLREKIASLPGFKVATPGAIFNEFVVTSPKPVSKINQTLLGKNILGGLNLEPFYPELKNAMLICATETKSKEQLDYFIQSLKEICS